jgi:hypothetical protein
MQVIAKRCEQLIVEKDFITQVVSQPKRDDYQYRIEDDHSDTLEDTPLAAMRAPCGDSFGNRTRCPACQVGSSYLPCLCGVVDSTPIFGCL